jgi:hypothetical protein
VVFGGAAPVCCQQQALCSNGTTHLSIAVLCRSTSGLGKGDGINNHTQKWLYVSSQAGSCVQCSQHVG